MSSDGTSAKLDEVLRIVGLIETGVRNLSTRVDDVEANLQELRKDLDSSWHSAQSQLTDIRSDIRKLDRKFDLLNQDVMEVRSDQRDMNRRVDKLEEKAS